MSLTIKSRFADYLLAVLMLLALLNSAYFFLSVAKFGLVDWLVFNACSVAIIAYLICFTCFQISKKSLFLAIPLLPLYYYGTMGLFVMSWDAVNIIAQVTHILITLTLIRLLYVLLKQDGYASLGKGLLIGVLLFVPLIALILNYSQLHMEEFLHMLQKVL